MFFFFVLLFAPFQFFGCLQDHLPCLPDMCQRGAGLGNTHPEYKPAISNGVGKIHFPGLVDSFQEQPVEVVSVFMGEANQV